MKHDRRACLGDTEGPEEGEEMGRGAVGEVGEGIKADSHPGNAVCVCLWVRCAQVCELMKVLAECPVPLTSPHQSCKVTSRLPTRISSLQGLHLGLEKSMSCSGSSWWRDLSRATAP